MNNRPRAAYLFAKEAAQIPFPHNDILFIDTGVYTWMALDELASTAYYVHDYKTGFAAADALLRQNRLPQTEVERTQKNHAAYLEKLKQMEQANVDAQMRQNFPAQGMKMPQQPKTLLGVEPAVSINRNRSFKKRRK